MSLEEIAKSLIREVRQREAVSVGAATPLIEVIDAMREHNRGAVAVVDDEGSLIGIFSIRDMTSLDHSNHDWHKTLVSQAMTAKPVCVGEDDTLAVALNLMKEGSFRHLPQVDSDGCPTSILSIRDILGFVSEHFPKEFLNLPPDPGHEAKTPWGG
jgi:CBS domain-containing protein